MSMMTDGFHSKVAGLSDELEEALAIVREFVLEGRLQYDEEHGHSLGEGGFCSYCAGLTCDTDCLFERAKRLLARF